MPIEKQIDQLKSKLHIRAGVDLQQAAEEALRPKIYGKDFKGGDQVINDEIIDGQIASLERKVKCGHKDHKSDFELRKIKHDITRLKNWQKLRALVIVEKGLRKEADTLTHQITALKRKVGDLNVPRAERDRCSQEAYWDPKICPRYKRT
jgi:hypothetical protein